MSADQWGLDLAWGRHHFQKVGVRPLAKVWNTGWCICCILSCAYSVPPRGRPIGSPHIRFDRGQNKGCDMQLKKIRIAKMLAQGGRCYYCGKPMWVEYPEWFRAATGCASRNVGLFQCTAEHLHPRSEGGKDTPDNIVAACRFCNATRHKAKVPKTPALYRSLVRERVAKGRWNQSLIRFSAPSIVPACLPELKTRNDALARRKGP